MTSDDMTASVTQILLWYDVPEILLLRRGLDEFVLAVASGRPQDGADQFVGASMTIDRLAAYQEGKCDLRYALSHANLRRYWTFTFIGEETEVTLRKVKKLSNNVELSLPDSGFFARDHDPIEVVSRAAPDADERFDIDGSWELGEFSRFYGQVEDIYYVYNDLLRYEDVSTSANMKSKIAHAMDKPFRGGGSYRSYYQAVANDNYVSSQLRVSGIQYHSPGYVAVKARSAPFNNLIALLQSYSVNYVATRKGYLKLYGYLQAQKLLRVDSTHFPDTKNSIEIESRSRQLETYLPGVNYSTLLSIANGNNLVASKVILSIYRRLERLYQFFEEGRVKYEGLQADLLVDEETI